MFPDGFFKPAYAYKNEKSIAKKIFVVRLKRLKKSDAVKNPFNAVAEKMKPLFSAFEAYVRSQVLRFEPEVRDAARDCISPKGKFLRPMLVFASAHAGKFDKHKIINRASIVELTHLSTLIHDDVIDMADMRRGCMTAGKKYGARTAILLGDAMFANTIMLALEERDFEMSSRVADAVKTICEGEIRQTLKKSFDNVTRRRYYNIVYGKTAVLFELSCWLGASCSGLGKEWILAASEAGKQLGIAYQIYDDVCDWFMSEADAGKTLGTDIASGKQTFPLILLLEKLSPRESAKLAENLTSVNPLDVAAKMRELGVPQECAREFYRRIGLAEKSISSFEKESEMLAEFCGAMRSLNIG